MVDLLVSTGAFDQRKGTESGAPRIDKFAWCNVEIRHRRIRSGMVEEADGGRE